MTNSNEQPLKISEVKIDGGHDITSEDGVKTLLKMALQFLGD